ncbi:hypothetical protein N9N03_00105 [Chlamydiia bacterium]|nr:hypothetical protein [Chlamydiia bacterium]
MIQKSTIAVIRTKSNIYTDEKKKTSYELVHFEDCTKTFLGQHITTKAFRRKITKTNLNKINVCITNENQNRFIELCISDGVPSKKVYNLQTTDHTNNENTFFESLVPLVNIDKNKDKNSHSNVFLLITPGSFPRLKSFLNDFKRFLMNIKCDVKNTTVVIQYSCKKHLSLLSEVFYSIRNIQFVHHEDSYQKSYYYDFVINASGSYIKPELFFPANTIIQTCCGSNSMLPADGTQCIKRRQIFELREFMIGYWDCYRAGSR